MKPFDGKPEDPNVKTNSNSNPNTNPNLNPNLNPNANGPKKGSFEEKAKESFGKFTDKVGSSFEKLKKNENVEELRKFAVEHQRDTIVYVVLLIGLILSLFRPFLGHALIGIVVGLYFAEELVAGSKQINGFIERQGLFRIVVFCFIGLALFLAAPGIFLGAAVALAIKLLIAPRN